MSAEMPGQGRLRLTDRNLRDILGPAPGVNETQGDKSYKGHVEGMRANGEQSIM